MSSALNEIAAISQNFSEQCVKFGYAEPHPGEALRDELLESLAVEQAADDIAQEEDEKTQMEDEKEESKEEKRHSRRKHRKQQE